MRYLLMHRLDENQPDAWNPSPEFVEKMGAFMTEYAESGVLLAAEGVHRSDQGAMVTKRRGGSPTVTDGPFTEAREVIGGFAVLQVDSKEEAIEHARRFADLFPEVSVEVRRVMEFDDLPGDVQDTEGARAIDTAQGHRDA
jgi:hypothetical protein